MIFVAEAILSLGSNLGDRVKNLNDALKAINSLCQTKIIRASNFYETEPFGVQEEQENYINCCVKVSTDLSSEMLLGGLLGIESAMGRKRTHRFCSRTIDIDLLLYDNEVQNKKNLVLPHPRMFERGFVLVPMSEICENMQFGNLNFRNAFENCDKQKIKLVSTPEFN